MDEQAQSRSADAAPRAESVGPTASEFDRFRDLPMQAAVHLDRRRLLVRELLSLERESLIRLERPAGENVDLVLNGKVIGAGEIVVIEEMVGLRITDILKDGPE